jgi:putative pyridoxal-dependent aspartate 1-decarboxylase
MDKPDVEQLEHVSVMKYFRPDSRSSYFGRVSIGFDGDSAAAAPPVQELRATFGNTDIPHRPTSIDHYLASFVNTVMPGVVHVSSPTFIGHMTSALPTFMPELTKLVAQLNQNVVKIETSRSVTFLERQVVAMMHKLFFALPQEHYDHGAQDPAHTFGIVTSGGSVSNLMAMWCARNRALVAMGGSQDGLARRGAVKVQQELGCTGGVIIGSRLMHYSIRKVASLLGIGEEGIRLVPQKNNQKISVTDLEATIRHVRESGEFIIALVGIAGATETGTIDPLDEIAEIAEKYNLHFHVDAAWGGALQFSERFRHKLRGIERADSITLCPHKQLYLPVGISLCLFRDSSSLSSIAVHANYQAAGGSYDLGQFSLEGSRPANAVLLHASLHLIAVSGYDWLIEQSMNTADYFARLVEVNDYFELIGKPEINIINYRFIPAGIFRGGQQRYSETENEAIDAAVRGIQEAQFSRGKTFVSKTRILHGDHADYPLWVFRVVIANPLTTREDLHSVLQEQLTIAADIIEDGMAYANARIRSGMCGPWSRKSSTIA